MWTENFENPATRCGVAEKGVVTSKIATFLWHANSKYGCSFTEDFGKELYKIAYDKQIPSEKAIDALAEAWEIWKPYVSTDSFERFMQESIKELFRNHATATAHSTELRAYIGNKATVEKALPIPLSTAVSMNGQLLKNGAVMPLPA